MKNFILPLSIIIFVLITIPQNCFPIRIKDIADIKGVRQNQLVGYGLVVGLDGTGDDDKTEFTRQSLVSMLKGMGIFVNPKDVKVDNTAAVMVTATLPPFSRSGSRIDVVVSSIGNADSLQGGTLLLTPLKAPNGEIYAVAQGQISIGGFAVKGAAGSVQKNHPTVGKIPAGAIIEKELSVNLFTKNHIDINLKEPDFTTSLRIANVIEENFGKGIAESPDAGTVTVKVTDTHRTNIVAFLSLIENLEITPDTVAKVVLNERTGTIVMGEKVRISTVAISHGGLSIIVKEQPEVVQPLPFTTGETTVVPRTEIEVVEEEADLIVIPEGANIGEVVRGLNSIGATPRDLIAILQAIKAAGALKAELEII